MRKIDLTYPFTEGMCKYPSDPEPKISITPARIFTEEQIIWDESGTQIGATPETKCKSGYSDSTLRNHHGTHIDAPAHKIPNGKTIDCYKIEKFINQARMIDLRKTGIMQRESRCISQEDIVISLQSQSPRSQDLCEFVQNLSALILYTGFCDEILDRNFKGDKRDFEKTFPYLSIGAADYIASHAPNLNIIGIDSFSVDMSGSQGEVHRIFFAKEILPLETLVYLGNLSSALSPKFELYSVPLNYKRQDAAPTRAFAILP